MLEHSIQTALLARGAGASDAQIAAALLHDIGTFVSTADGCFGEYAHDRSGGEWLAQHFPRAVSEPVRLHVAAKRYLCATRPGYLELLSSASTHTLAHQGGPMDDSTARAFERETFFNDALALREWDDQGKTPGMEVPAAAAFRGLLGSLLS